MWRLLVVRVSTRRWHELPKSPVFGLGLVMSSVRGTRVPATVVCRLARRRGCVLLARSEYIIELVGSSEDDSTRLIMRVPLHLLLVRQGCPASLMFLQVVHVKSTTQTGFAKLVANGFVWRVLASRPEELGILRFAVS